MKKVGLFIVFWMASVIAFAQTGIGHLMFKDIPIDGKRSEFIGKLVQKGYRYLPGDDPTILQGEYAGYKECRICLQASVNDNMICVVIDFPRWNTWTELLANYSSIKNTLINRYGAPSDCMEIFTTDSCTKFDNEVGTITLRIEDDGLRLVYLDKVNEAIAQYDSLQHDNTIVPMPSNEVYKLFPTENAWIFIKLNTRNGNMWQVQFEVETILNIGNGRSETILNDRNLVTKDEEENGRFTLYPTTNAYNFILLDQIDGRTWQVQWSMKDKGRKIMPINDVPDSY